MTSTPLKVMLAGAWTWPWYHEACAEALEALGCRVIPFGWNDRFWRPMAGRTEPGYRSKWHAAQNRFLFGPALVQLNEDFFQLALFSKPDIVFLYHCTHILPGRVAALKRALPDTVFVQYTNDNPFGEHGLVNRMRYIRRMVPVVDLNLAYRHSNIADFDRAGSPRTHLLRSYYLPQEDYPVKLGPSDEQWRCDVLFAGHFEPDGRQQMLEQLIRAGHKVHLFGGGWMEYAKIDSDSPLQGLLPIRPVVGADYRKAICGAKIALCFLSKSNRDTYTRRNFQIPAMGTLMLSEYTDDLDGMFAEGQEAAYFRSPLELQEKVDYYLLHDEKRRAVARAGRERLLRDGHDVVSRMKQLLRLVREARQPALREAHTASAAAQEVSR